jgi:hypothetical protein
VNYRITGGVYMSKLSIRKTLFFLVCSLILSGVGYFIATLISNQFDLKLQEAMFVEGLIVIIIGALSSIKGNPSGSSIQGFGQGNAQYGSILHLEVTRMERESTNYYKNFLKQSVAEFALSNITIIMCGIFIIILSFL